MSRLAELAELADRDAARRYICTACHEGHLVWGADPPDPPICPDCTAMAGRPAASPRPEAMEGVPSHFVGAMGQLRATKDRPPDAAWRWAGRPATLLLWGPTGTGKSTLAVALLERLAGIGARCAYVTTGRLMQELGEEYSGRRSGVLRRYIGADVLAVDELGTEPMRSDTAPALNLLVDERWSRDRPTIYITNLPPVRPRKNGRVVDVPSLEDYDPRLVSRLVSGRVVHVAGVDRRLARREEPRR